MKKKSIVILLLACLLPAFANAREQYRLLSLEECVDSALANNPAIGAAALEVEKSRVLRRSAFDPPKTEILLKQETTGGGGTENGVFFGQDFDFPTLYVARHRALLAGNELQISRFRVLEAEIEKEVSSIYYSLLYIDRLLDLNSELDSIYGEFCRVAGARMEVGESGALEVMNAERAREKNSLARMDLIQRQTALTIRMQTVTGCTLKVLPSGKEFGPIPYLSETEAFDFNRTVRGAAADNEVMLAEKEITVARNEFMPGIRVGATVQAFLKGFNPYHVDRQPFDKGNFMGIEVGITVPLFFSAGSSRLKAAGFEREISILRREAAAADAGSEVLRLSADLESLKQRLGRYVSTSVPRADEIKRISLVSYNLGEIDYVEYIANLEAVYSVYQEYADCVNEYNQTVISLKNICQ